jgi:hypothetical protein
MKSNVTHSKQKQSPGLVLIWNKLAVLFDIRTLSQR